MGLFDKVKDAVTGQSGPPEREAFRPDGGGQRMIAGAPHYPSGWASIVAAGTKNERARYPFTARVVREQAAEWATALDQIEAAGFEVHTEAAVVAGFDGGRWGGFIRLPEPGPLLEQFSNHGD